MVTQSKFEPMMSSTLLDAGARLTPHHYKIFSSQLQYQLVIGTVCKLQESGFYWGAISGKEANSLLSEEPVGTFLVRDSSDRRHFFALSIKTAFGPKNLRIQCDGNSFFLQADPRGSSTAPHFNCVLKLVHHYMPAKVADGKGGMCGVYFIHTGGEKIPLELLRPLSSSMSTLQHLCRKAVNGHLDMSDKRDLLPRPVKEFLEKYDSSI
uniref:Suppressor of cytokine signaling 3 n=1 Tax=Paramormyrops kingsleyae TaxID=1676925 RepID=A0A3B3SCD1_9TELE|nr:suppressor of cytokine signaling 3-like [Paramormyrops kingsleyae]